MKCKYFQKYKGKNLGKNVLELDVAHCLDESTLTFLLVRVQADVKDN